MAKASERSSVHTRASKRGPRQRRRDTLLEAEDCDETHASGVKGYEPYTEGLMNVDVEEIGTLVEYY